MSIFKGIKDAKGGDGGTYLSEGAYIVDIDACKQGEMRDGTPFFVVEFTILQNSGPECNKPGTTASYFVKVEKDTPALANIRRFISVASDTPEDEIDDAGAEMVVSKDQPLKGTVLRVQATQIVTKKGNDFTKHVWSKFEGTEEDAGKLRKAAVL